jgi:hypothetical protein
MDIPLLLELVVLVDIQVALDQVLKVEMVELAILFQVQQ